MSMGFVVNKANALMCALRKGKSEDDSALKYVGKEVRLPTYLPPARNADNSCPFGMLFPIICPS